MSDAASATPVSKAPAKLIWATRGRTWGFRFIRDGGFPDPLVAYEAAFSGVGDEPKAWRRVNETVALSFPGVARTVALRFPDPENRQDAAGRVIPHEFVVFPPVADGINSFEDGRELVWRLVAYEFARIWKLPQAALGSRWPLTPE